VVNFYKSKVSIVNIFIVYAHPSKNGYTHEILQHLLKKLKNADHQTIISDLYAMKFRPELNADEYLREASSKTDIPVAEDIQLEQEKIESSDCIIFLYPLWWSDCPAILKGWFDRVFTVGYAYDYDENGKHFVNMKKIKHGLVICTAGASNSHLDNNGIAESMRKIMLEDRLGSNFENKKMIILGGTLNIDKVRHEHLDKVNQINDLLL